ncbi:SDR family NAD(P)-dependent oxidoreductase [Gracilinema caldarium]|uniref:SDR family NAD(P)-dependent oxidoreductase n=1 Tax=Gracilinema caldarium TaxID=215591 RepID=UPI0026EC0E19|nr:SDR family NAD(P)-dependent oxidoreductase [Gracilinema caldarium]
MENHELSMAPLLRGLYLHNAGRSVVVLRGEQQINTDCQIDVRPAFADGTYNEGLAAKIGAEACASWLFEHGPSGAGAVQGNQKPITLPSCLNVQTDSELETYWVDWDLDSCRRRMQAGDTGTLEVPIKKNGTKIRTIGAATDTYQALVQDRSRFAEGKIALVTGGAQGFGEELVRGLIAARALVFIADLNGEGAAALAERLNTQYGKTVALPAVCNVADEESVRDLFSHIEQQVGGLDICISNAGVLKAGSVLDQDLGAFKLVTDVNYTAFFLVTKYAARLMRLQAMTAGDWYTDIVQINSKSGLEGSNKNGAYAGSKFGGIGLVQSFAMELVDYRIKVNAICPGNFFDGPLWSDPEKGLFVQYLAAGKVPGAKTVADVRAFYEAKVPMKRGCTGPDVLKALFYIIEQEYETGQAVPVTGGQVMLH